VSDLPEGVTYDAPEWRVRRHHPPPRWVLQVRSPGTHTYETAATFTDKPTAEMVLGFFKERAHYTLQEGVMQCPFCDDEDLIQVEEIGVYRSLHEWATIENADGSTDEELHINGQYETFDGSENERLACLRCSRTYELPTHVDYV